MARSIVRRIVRVCLHNATRTLAFLPLTTLLKIEYLKSPPWEGDKVMYRVYAGVPHDAGSQSAPDVVGWIFDCFAGKPPPSTC